MNVRDTWGGAAQFGAMYSTPTNTQAIHVAVLWVVKGSQAYCS